MKNKKIKYEPPQVLDLEDVKQGKGDCASGSSDITNCVPGNSASFNCSANGNTAGFGCEATGSGF